MSQVTCALKYFIEYFVLSRSQYKKSKNKVKIRRSSLNNIRVEKTIHTVFRVFFSLIFVLAGFQHLFASGKVAAKLAHSPFAPLLTQLMPLETHILLAGIILLAAGLALLMGIWTKQAALILLAVLIPITVTVQMGGEETLGPLFKNIALMGGLIYFSYFGTQGWGLGSIFKSKKLMTYAGIFPFILALLTALAGGFTKENISIFQVANASSPAPGSLMEKSLAILVREPKHIPVAILTAKQGLKGQDGLKISTAVIIVCGKPGVKALKLGSKSEKSLQEAQAAGIQITACGLSLKEAGLTAEQLIKTVKVVENGLWEIIKLQAQGSISIEL